MYRYLPCYDISGGSSGPFLLVCANDVAPAIPGNMLPIRKLLPKPVGCYTIRKCERVDSAKETVTRL